MFFNINSSYAVNNFGRINRKNSNMKRIVLLILIIYLGEFSQIDFVLVDFNFIYKLHSRFSYQ